MKIPNKIELQQIAKNHSPDIDFKDFKKINKTFTEKPYSFLSLSLDNPLRLKENLKINHDNWNKLMTIEINSWQLMIRLRMKKKLQYDIKRGAAKISSSSSGKTG